MEDAESGPLISSEDEDKEAKHKARGVRRFSSRQPPPGRRSGFPAWISLNRNFRCLALFVLAITGYAVIHAFFSFDKVATISGDVRSPSELGSKLSNQQAEIPANAKSSVDKASVKNIQDKENKGMPYDFTIPDYTPQWYHEVCFSEANLGNSIDEIYKKLEILKGSSASECKALWQIFNRVFRMYEIDAPIVLPEEFKPEVKGWLGNDTKLFDQVSHQKVYKIVNKYSFEETVFNPLRSKRPTSKSSVDPLVYIANLTESTKPTCDFCSFEKHTAADSFGRIVNNLTATASNTFKLAKFHGLFFPKDHHPVNISREAILELFVETSQQWFAKAHDADSTQRYPSLLWDTLPHAGASQVHPHVHGILDSHQYTGSFEKFHELSQLYYRDYGKSFWNDIVLVHWALGLGTAVGDGKSAVIVPLFARKDHEFVVISAKADQDFAISITKVLQAYKNSLNVYCFSAGGTYPFIGSYDKDLDRYEHPGLPALFRFGSRGSCTSIGSDVSSLELYSVNNINSNISVTMQALVYSSQPE